MIKVDGQFIVSSACNNGTTALVTRDGELLMFGKDTTHADPTTGNFMGSCSNAVVSQYFFRCRL